MIRTRSRDTIMRQRDFPCGQYSVLHCVCYCRFSYIVLEASPSGFYSDGLLGCR